MFYLLNHLNMMLSYYYCYCCWHFCHWHSLCLCLWLCHCHLFLSHACCDYAILVCQWIIFDSILCNVYLSFVAYSLLLKEYIRIVSPHVQWSMQCKFIQHFNHVLLSASMCSSYLMFKSCAIDVISLSVIAQGSHQNSTLHPILAFICHDFQSSDKRKIYHMVLILVQSCIDDSSTFIFIAPFLKNLFNCPLISLTRRSHFDYWIVFDCIPCRVIV